MAAGVLQALKPSFQLCCFVVSSFYFVNIFHLSLFWPDIHVGEICVSILKMNIFLIPAGISIYLDETVPLKNIFQCLDCNRYYYDCVWENESN